ncbi:MAG: hypothetical protein OXI87_02245 [Albidovulum sp.]|nr:hypothetical protein [Albidovulum sp.]MDE0303696.1 hypothetical protein [Albidovulum sp.]
MTEHGENDVDINTQRTVAHPGGVNGGHFDRINEFDKRLVRIETLLENAATKDDISKVKIWFLIGVISAIGIAVPAAIGVGFLAARVAFLLTG